MRALSTETTYYLVYDINQINYSDPLDAPHITPESRRLAQLAQVLRGHTLLDIDCWSSVHGQPIAPGAIYNELDPFAARWMRNLIDGGHIAQGVVDERSI